MKRLLKAAEENHNVLKIFYINQAGQVTERFIRVLKCDESSLIAYCYWRKKIRRFAVANILAVEKKHDSA
ncbi:hypothetical protein ACFFIS_17390 [Virgibacillus soli]|uniref:hypothetical protein n=1 Tax=Paracerasibacillus soli TaxID=480284 RepID=UPI0035E9EDF6